MKKLKEVLWQKFFMQFFAEQLRRNRMIAYERGLREGIDDIRSLRERRARRAA